MNCATRAWRWRSSSAVGIRTANRQIGNRVLGGADYCLTNSNRVDGSQRETECLTTRASRVPYAGLQFWSRFGVAMYERNLLGAIMFLRKIAVTETNPRGAQHDEKFSGPKKDVEQPAFLKIGDIGASQADVESLTRTFLNKCLCPNDIRVRKSRSATPRIQTVKVPITLRQEVI